MKNLVIFLLSLSFTLANQSFLHKFNTGNRLFAASIYKEISKKNIENFIVCPLSAEIILGLVQSGARDETSDEIRSALNFPNNTKEIDLLFKSLLSALKSNKYYTFHTANKMYIKENYPIKEEFKKIAADVYKSAVENMNFSQNIQAAKTINDWVEEQTQNKIHNLISENSLNDNTVAVLINALYFKGEWKRNFKRHLTQKKDFYRNQENIIKVDMMINKGFYDYYEDSELDAKFLKIPFKGNKHVQMIIVLPNQKQGLKSLEKQIKKTLNNPKLTGQYVNVALPKFKLETNVDFKPILKKMGVNKAFAHGDFSGISGNQGEIEISEIVQKTFIGVDEDGVEAASATAVNFHSKSLLIDYRNEEKDFIVDHPFLFYIKIKNILVFVGRVSSPIF